jgi:hypothetical protein
MLLLSTQQLGSQEDWPFYSPHHPLTDAVREDIVRVRSASLWSKRFCTAWPQNNLDHNYRPPSSKNSTDGSRTPSQVRPTGCHGSRSRLQRWPGSADEHTGHSAAVGPSQVRRRGRFTGMFEKPSSPASRMPSTTASNRPRSPSSPFSTRRETRPCGSRVPDGTRPNRSGHRASEKRTSWDRRVSERLWHRARSTYTPEVPSATSRG